MDNIRGYLGQFYLPYVWGMKNVYFLLPDGRMKPGLLFLAIEIFETVNQYLVDKGCRPYYDIKIVGHALSQQLCNSHIRIYAAKVNSVVRPDLIIISGGSEKNDYSKKSNRNLTQWLIEQYKNGAELASLCTGSFLLAATGLLNNMKCTTHWKMAELLAKMHPEIELCSDKIITECKGIYTSSGAVSSMNLMLYFVEKYNGRRMAVYCAKMMHIDIDRNSPSAYIIFEGQKNHDDETIKKVQNYIERNSDDKITVEYLAEEFAIPKRSLVRRFKKATNNTVIEYIQRIKIEAAKRMLEIDRKPIKKIMYDVGYADVKAFRNIFKKISSVSPVEYRKKYNKDFVR